jgi:hypothetical protein
MIAEFEGGLLIAENQHRGAHAHHAAFQERQRAGDDLVVEDVLHRVLARILRVRRGVRVQAILHCDLRQRLVRHLVLVLVALGHERVVRGVHPAQLAFEILACGGGDVAVAHLRGDLVHALPADDGYAVGVAGGDGLACGEHAAAAGGAAGLDLDVAQRIEAQVVVHLGRGEELIAEVIGELRVHAPVHHGRGSPPARPSGRSPPRPSAGPHAQFAGVLLGVLLAEVGESTRHREDRTLEMGNPQVPLAESNHGDASTSTERASHGERFNERCCFRSVDPTGAGYQKREQLIDKSGSVEFIPDHRWFGMIAVSPVVRPLPQRA